MTGSDYEKALEHVQDENFHKAKEHISKEEDMTLFAELERLAYTQDAISNYSDRLIDDLAKEINEEE